MSKEPIRNAIIDKFFLIGCSIVVLSGLVVLIFLLEDYLSVRKGWLVVLLLSLVYTTAVTTYSRPVIKKLEKRWKAYSVLFILQALVIGIVSLCFSFGIIRLPEEGILPYGIATGLLGTATVFIFDGLMNRMKKGRKRR